MGAIPSSDWLLRSTFCTLRSRSTILTLPCRTAIEKALSPKVLHCMTFTEWWLNSKSTASAYRNCVASMRGVKPEYISLMSAFSQPRECWRMPKLLCSIAQWIGGESWKSMQSKRLFLKMTLNSRDVRHKVRRPFSSVNLPTQRRISSGSPKSGIFAEVVDLRWHDWSRELVVTGGSKMMKIENSWRDLERGSLKY